MKPDPSIGGDADTLPMLPHGEDKTQPVTTALALFSAAISSSE